MNRVQIIHYKGKRIVFLDFSNVQTIEEIIVIANQAKQYIHLQPLLSVFSLTTIEGMHFNNAIRDVFTELAKSNKPYVKAGAIIGVTGMKQILFNGIMKITGRDIKAFNTIDLAREWLASHN